ncbi:4a-hydroxytetrahydrobiopterin dehydratase [Metallosphaera sp.]|uniref:4a-hydroxytetrahydrobiopterin dehydratase n=1 Tax=Metallosphaera sp. TaxID=2020860 RepID=UPI003165B2FB
MVKLNLKDIESSLNELKGWKFENDTLVKDFIFKDFSNSVKFLTMVQPVADSLDHHPDVCIFYNKVRVTLTTHDEGGVTDLDVKLAKKLDELAKLFEY